MNGINNTFDPDTKRIYNAIFFDYSNFVLRTMFNRISKDNNSHHYWFFGTTKPSIYLNLVEEFSWDPRRKDVVCLTENDLLGMKKEILGDLQALFPDYSITMDDEHLHLKILKKS